MPITTSDFIKADISISSIQNIYYTPSIYWSRNVPTARAINGIVLFTGGSIEYFFDEKRVISKKGDILKLAQNDVYWGKRLSDEPNSYYVIDFHTVHKNEYREFPQPICFTPRNFEIIKNEFQNMLDIWGTNTIASSLVCKSKLYNLLSIILGDYASQYINTKTLDSITLTTNYINNNYKNPDLNVTELCRVFLISESQLRKNFNAAFHMSPLDYIHSQRINLAKNMLIYEKSSVGEIAEKCGFSSLYYFSRLFKRKIGMSPMQYRKVTPPA